MEKVKTSKRLKQAMNIHNLKQIDLLKKCKIICDKYNEKYNLKLKVSKSDLSQWLAGLYEPSQKKLSVLAEALNVNEAWLMGYDIPMENHLINDKTNELTDKIEKLNDEQKEIIIKMIDNMKRVDINE